ncbi:MAG: hypothetical protein KAS73_10050 [Candidatus Sabulitectum sp.]|nr:hypothetical protein [Candidatus Sabulitectum sp.]
MIIREIETALSPVLKKKQEACSMHSLFNYKYPIGIGVSDKLHIFREHSGAYQYTTTVTLPMQVQEGTKAAFPVNELGECCCIITPGCLEESDCFATILHEFVHCYQSRTCEDKLKAKLGIYQQAVIVQDYMWEIDHPFPYENPDYLKLLQNITGYDFDQIMDALSMLSEKLESFDCEYMIWQIWKEGFARYIENRILRMNAMEENNNGSDPESPDRTSLYFIGNKFWTQLKLRNQSLVHDIEKGFTHLENNYGLPSIHTNS